MRSSNGWNLSCTVPTVMTQPGADVGFADLGAVEEGAVGRVQIAKQVPLGVAQDLAVHARHGLLGQDQVVLVDLADADDVAGDDELFAALAALEHDQLALREVNGASRRRLPSTPSCAVARCTPCNFITVCTRLTAGLCYARGA